MNPIKFDRKPYTISYTDAASGEKRTIRRVPPPKLHAALPQDRVELTTTKNSNFEAGDSYKVKHINPRLPNVLQLEDGYGTTIFVSHYEIRLDDAVNAVTPRAAGESGDTGRSLPTSNRYLLWP